MESLQKSIPDDLKMMIMSTATSDVAGSCAALHDHFSASLLFRQLLEQLVNPVGASCAKDSSVALDSKLDGNNALTELKYEKALSSYTKALRYARFTKEEDRAFLATVFVNRAATSHKLIRLESALRDCGRAIDLFPPYSKAWYRRSRVKSDMLDLEGAVADMKEALAREKTGGGRRQIENELALMILKLKSRESSSNATHKAPTETMSMQREDLLEAVSLKMDWSDERGWDLRTNEELPIGSLVLEEEAYAAIVLKTHRDTHCHFCFELLPPDAVPCRACAIPLYCSDLCMYCATAGNDPLAQTLSSCHNRDVSKSILPSSERHGEHTHECGGCTWSAVLPIEVVLAARVLLRSVYEDNHRAKESKGSTKGRGNITCLPTRMRPVETLCAHYDNLTHQDKLDLHVLGVVVAHCVQLSSTPYWKCGSLAASEVASKLVLLMAQTRVNAMAIYCMSSPDSTVNKAISRRDSPMTSIAFSTVEQVKIARGIFLLGSTLNHSCVPNVHASFKKRRLSVHSVTNISADCSLDLCYGPQVGHMNQQERRMFLRERYYFTCNCPACAMLTSSDLFLRSFKCTKQGCTGAVLGPDVFLHFPVSEDLFQTPALKILGEEKARVGDSSSQNSDKLGSLGKSGGEADALQNNIQTVSRYNSLCKSILPDISSLTVKEKQKLVCKGKVGSCLHCGTAVDVEGTQEIANMAVSHLEGIESMLVSQAPVIDLIRALRGAVEALETLRAIVHAYNERLAKGEDIVARLLCALDKPSDGLRHCENAIHILEQLYNKHHIVLGNEYLKLASIALAVPDVKYARRTLDEVDFIFRIHYGTDYCVRLPYIAELLQLVQQ